MSEEKKYPFEVKTVKELSEEVNKAFRENGENGPEYTLEEMIEDDAEGGYDYYEDEEIPLTYEIVHSGREEPPYIKCVEGDFDDGTSYVAELWIEDNTTFVTYYFSTENLENDEKAIEKYLIKVGKLKEGETHHFGIVVITIDSNVINRLVDLDIYSVTVAVGDDDETFCEAIL